MSLPAHPSIRGRDAERAAVSALVAAAHAGDGRALVLTGPTGIGKTTLLRGAADEAEQAGVRVLATAGAESEVDLPYAPLERLLEPVWGDGTALGAAHIGLRRTIRTGRSVEAVRGAIEAEVWTVMRSLAAEGPLLILIDDAHWLHPCSAAALTYVALRLRGVGLSLLFSDAADDRPGRLDRAIPRLRLSGLDDATARDLLGDLVAESLPGDIASAIVAIAEGNPLALVDLARSLSAHQLEGEAPLPAALPPHSQLRRAHGQRLAELPAETRWLVLLAAADGDLSVAELAEAATNSGTDLSALAAAERADIIRVDGNRIAFTQPLLRQIAYHDATLAERRAAHDVLATITEAAPDPLRHLLHKAAAVGRRDPALAAQLVDAAPAGPPAIASEALERAAELTPRAGPAASALVESARWAWMGGRPHRAMSLLRTVRGAGVPAGVLARAQALKGEIELRAGVTLHARNLLLAAAHQMTGRDPRSGQEMLTAMILAGEAMCLSGQHMQFAQLADQALALRVEEDRPDLELLHAYFGGQAALYRRDIVGSARPLRRVMELAPQLDSSVALVRASTAALLLGDPMQGHQLATRAVAVAGSAGEAAVMPQALELLAAAELGMGRHDAAILAASEGVRLARATGQESLANNHVAMLAVLAALDGERDDALLRVRAVRGNPNTEGLGQAQAFATWALGLIDLFEGRFSAAVSQLRTLLADADGGGNLMVQVPATLHIIEAAARFDEDAQRGRGIEAAPGGMVKRLRAHLSDLDAWANLSGSPAWLALAARGHALISADATDSEAYFEQALRYHHAGEADYGRARTELLYGQDLRRRRRPIAARELLRSALHTFEQLGANPWAEQTRAELRAAGESIEPRRIRRTDELTPQQQQIASLVASGATNREIAARLYLSHRTVEHHLRNIFSRLGVRSRTELASLLA